MSYYHERESDFCVNVSEDMPSKVLYHNTIFILACADICLQVHIGFTKAMMTEKLMRLTNDCISPLTTVACFVC